MNVQIDKSGRDDGITSFDGSSRGSGKLRSDGDDRVASYRYVRREPWTARSVNDAAVSNEKVVCGRLACEIGEGVEQRDQNYGGPGS